MPAAAKADRAGTVSWMFFDWAAQPFHTLLITFTFAPYFVAHVASSPQEGQAVWGLATGCAGLFIALLAPFLGALADRSGPRKPWIAGFGLLAAIGAALLWFAMPGPGAPVIFVLTAFAIGLIGIEFAGVFVNAMMPSLVPRAELGKLSGSGWALGYVGGLVSLVLALGFMLASPETGRTLLGVLPLPGLDPLTHAGDRATGPLTAIWLLVFAAPLFLFTPDTPRVQGSRVKFGETFAELIAKLKQLPARRAYFAFLASSMFYRDGLNALYAFGGIYAAGILGLTTIQLGVFGILATITGALGAFIGGRLDARFGPRAVVFTNCWLLVLVCLVIVSTTRDTVLFFLPVSSQNLPVLVFYAAGSLIGMAGGALQAASRTLLVDQVEASETSEAFGLYALTGRATAFIGPLAIGAMTALTNSQRIGITPVIVLLAVGAAGLYWVREKSG